MNDGTENMMIKKKKKKLLIALLLVLLYFPAMNEGGDKKYLKRVNFGNKKIDNLMWQENDLVNFGYCSNILVGRNGARPVWWCYDVLKLSKFAFFKLKWEGKGH